MTHVFFSHWNVPKSYKCTCIGAVIYILFILLSFKEKLQSIGHCFGITWRHIKRLLEGPYIGLWDVRFEEQTSMKRPDVDLSLTYINIKSKVKCILIWITCTTVYLVALKQMSSKLSQRGDFKFINSITESAFAE